MLDCAIDAYKATSARIMRKVSFFRFFYEEGRMRWLCLSDHTVKDRGRKDRPILLKKTLTDRDEMTFVAYVRLW